MSLISNLTPFHPKKSAIFQGTRILYGDLTPLIPLSLGRRAKEGLRPSLKLFPLLLGKGKGIKGIGFSSKNLRG